MSNNMDPCIGKFGRDICHLGQMPRQIDFSTLPELRQQHTSNTGKRTELKSASEQNEKSVSDISDPNVVLARGIVDAIGGTPRKKRDETFRMVVPRPRPNTQALSVEAINKARMIQIGRDYYKKGLSYAQAEIDNGSLRGWKIDPELSNQEGVVLKKGATIKVAYRGTHWFNINDVITDAATMQGVEELAPQIRSSKQQLQQIRAKYNALPSELIGYSKGAVHAMTLGDQFKIPTTTFNPLIGPKQLATQSKVEHSIYRTMEDPVSSLLALSKKKNYKVKAIDPIRGMHDPRSIHKMDQFTNAGNRQPGGIEILMNDGVRMGQTVAHYETLDAMKTGMEQGKSFTQTLDDFNRSNGHVQRVDVTEEGRLGPRIHNESSTVQYWKQMGGQLTEVEQQHLNSNRPPPPRQFSQHAMDLGLHQTLTPAQIDHVNAMSTDERASFMRTQRSNLQSHMNSIDESVKPHERIIRGLMPKSSSLATGVVSGLAAHALMNTIDPQHKMNALAEEATEGAIAGGIGAGGVAALGGSAMLLPEALAGSAGYLAGAESQKAITGALTRGGMNQDNADLIGGISGGGIGGVTAATTGVLGTAAASMLAGEEIGGAIGLVGGPAGVAIGMLGGAAVGSVVGGIGYLMTHGEKHHDPPPPPPPPPLPQPYSHIRTSDGVQVSVNPVPGANLGVAVQSMAPFHAPHNSFMI